MMAEHSSAQDRGRRAANSGHGSLEKEVHFSSVQRAHTSQLKSPVLLEEAIKKSEVADKYGVDYSPQSLSKNLKTDFNQGAEVLTVTLTGDNPEALAAVLNALGFSEALRGEI